MYTKSLFAIFFALVSVPAIASECTLTYDEFGPLPWGQTKQITQTLPPHMSAADCIGTAVKLLGNKQRPAGDISGVAVAAVFRIEKVTYSFNTDDGEESFFGTLNLTSNETENVH